MISVLYFVSKLTEMGTPARFKKLIKTKIWKRILWFDYRIIVIHTNILKIRIVIVDWMTYTYYAIYSQTYNKKTMLDIFKMESASLSTLNKVWVRDSTVASLSSSSKTRKTGSCRVLVTFQKTNVIVIQWIVVAILYHQDYVVCEPYRQKNTR